VAQVVLLRGVNVGGHRRFRPSVFATELKHLDAISIGATGTFVIRQPVAREQLRAELARRLSFDAEIVICEGRDIRKLMADDPFKSHRLPAGTVRFVSVLSQRPRSSPSMPITFPSSGKWLLKILGRKGRFVFGVYRRDMKVIGYLGALDGIFGVPATTRNWNTMSAICKALGQ
jgi:uncharacterized protein (DUF1697 family)